MGLQLAELTDQQRDELALLVAYVLTVPLLISLVVNNHCPELQRAFRRLCVSPPPRLRLWLIHSLVVFRDQDLSPQKQKELGLYLGDGEIEIHPQVPQVPGVPGVTLIWETAREYQLKAPRGFRNAYPSGSYGCACLVSPRLGIFETKIASFRAH